MTRSKQQPSAPSEDTLDRLTSAVDQVIECVQELRSLTDEVRVLREAIDDVRQEIEWAVRNLARPAWTPTQPLASVCTPADGVPEHKPVDVPTVEASAQSQHARRISQGGLWE